MLHVDSYKTHVLQQNSLSGAVFQMLHWNQILAFPASLKEWCTTESWSSPVSTQLCPKLANLWLHLYGGRPPAEQFSFNDQKGKGGLHQLSPRIFFCSFAAEAAEISRCPMSKHLAVCLCGQRSVALKPGWMDMIWGLMAWWSRQSTCELSSKNHPGHLVDII